MKYLVCLCGDMEKMKVENGGYLAVAVMANFEYSDQGRPHQECDI